MQLVNHRNGKTLLHHCIKEDFLNEYIAVALSALREVEWKGLLPLGYAIQEHKIEAAVFLFKLGLLKINVNSSCIASVLCLFSGWGFEKERCRVLDAAVTSDEEVRALESVKAEIVHATCVGSHPTLLAKVHALVDFRTVQNTLGRGKPWITDIMKL